MAKRELEINNEKRNRSHGLALEVEANHTEMEE
jgi:hypothetical protein